ncbi:MAG: hypothetical protein IKX78_03815 [Clostridia bacterium]|nr:hypothetical protein [Clostridia bacterium]
MESDGKPRIPQQTDDSSPDFKEKKEPAAEKEKQKSREKDKKKHIVDWSWTIKILALTFIISFGLSYLSESVLADVNIVVAFFVLVFFILLGVTFDILGTAVMAAETKTFNSMAAKKVKGAKTALSLIAKAPSVSNFCNDVIGDICGVISGTTCSVLALKFAEMFSFNAFLSVFLFTATTASLTVGLKAIGKNIAVLFGDKIIYAISRVVCVFVPERIQDSKRKNNAS